MLQRQSVITEWSSRERYKKLKLDWRNRLVLIFAPSSKEGSYLEQKSKFEGKAGELEDRDIIIIELLKSGISMTAEIPLNNEQQSFLRKKFEVIDDFVFILMGKDGTVKLRAKEPVSSDDLFSLIDSMPMRKEEMRRKAGQSRNIN